MASSSAWLWPPTLAATPDTPSCSCTTTRDTCTDVPRLENLHLNCKERMGGKEGKQGDEGSPNF